MTTIGTFNGWIVALSFFIAAFASYSSLHTISKMTETRGRAKYYWLLTGAFVMGGGVWAMHFVGMLAFQIHMMVGYHWGWTFVSFIAAVFSAFIAFLVTSTESVKTFHLVIAGAIMGTGVVAMHYIGMNAMEMPGHISYSPIIVTISVVIALVASYASLFIFMKYRLQPTSIWLRISAAAIMAVAICGMHYTGMRAATFHIPMDRVAPEIPEVNTFLLFTVSMAIIALLSVSWISMYIDQFILKKMAFEDSVTNLPNRHDMNRFFRYEKENVLLAVLFIDLDQFKTINDTLGHQMGDLLVQHVGERLRAFQSFRTNVYRIGGDEFLMIVEEGSAHQAKKLANRILENLKQPFLLDGHELFVTASVGISIGRLREHDRMWLLKAADTAMYRAKALGKNRYCLYDDQMGHEEMRRMELERGLKGALVHEQFALVYQPKWDVVNGDVKGFEALIRWHHPQFGLVSPFEFIPLAEEFGQIVPITEWVLCTACHQSKKWLDEGRPYPISVNLSVRVFQTKQAVEMVKKALEVTGLPAELLELEITESMVFSNIEEVIEQLNALRVLGVKISMDDFGTGYSSIGLLDRLPLDTLKLDRLFTNDLHEEKKRVIVTSVVAMAKGLHFDIVAEGVETKEQVNMLAAMGCTVIQGYYYGKPMDIVEVDGWLEMQKSTQCM